MKFDQRKDVAIVPLNLFNEIKPVRSSQPIVHPISLFGTTFAMMEGPWPNIRPDWAKDIARAFFEDEFNGERHD